MNLIDRVLLEWSYKTKKGYPDINSQEDVALFESMFGFNITEEITKGNNIKAAQDFVNSTAAQTNNILKFKSGKYANRLSSTEIKDLDQIRGMLVSHFKLSDEDIIFHQKGEGLAAKDSVPGFQLNTKKFGEVYISVSTGKKGIGGLKAEVSLTNGINNITDSQGSITVNFTDGKRNHSVKGTSSARQVGSKQEVEGAKADVALYSEPLGNGRVVANISVKEDGKSESEFRWASVNNNKTPFRRAFRDRALTDENFPIELRRTGHHLDTDRSPKYKMWKRGTEERVTMVVVDGAPTDDNELYLFGTDNPKTVIATRSFSDDDFIFDDKTGVLTIKCTTLYTNIDQIQDTAVEPIFIVTQHEKQTYGLDFRIVPKGMANYGPNAKGINIKYSDVF
tara:strand:+ start:577 stop:1758 length:1182 start_codon:yes stop_codon:yes gene_type:complete